jgi:hypothetical protein
MTCSPKRSASSTHRFLYNAGASPDGVVENMRRLEIDPSSIEAIVCSHGNRSLDADCCFQDPENRSLHPDCAGRH